MDPNTFLLVVLLVFVLIGAYIFVKIYKINNTGSKNKKVIVNDEKEKDKVAELKKKSIENNRVMQEAYHDYMKYKSEEEKNIDKEKEDLKPKKESGEDTAKEKELREKIKRLHERLEDAGIEDEHSIVKEIKQTSPQMQAILFGELFKNKFDK